jgi:hypothetical protein
MRIAIFVDGWNIYYSLKRAEMRAYGWCDFSSSPNNRPAPQGERSSSERAGDWRWSPGYDEAVLLTQDLDFLRAVEVVASEPYCRRVHVLLPPSDPNSQKSAARADKDETNRFDGEAYIGREVRNWDKRDLVLLGPFAIVAKP